MRSEIPICFLFESDYAINAAGFTVAVTTNRGTNLALELTSETGTLSGRAARSEVIVQTGYRFSGKVFQKMISIGKLTKRLLPLSVLVLILIVAACGDDDSNGTDDAGSGDATETEETTDAATEETEEVAEDEATEEEVEETEEASDSDVTEEETSDVAIGESALDDPVTFADYGWDSAILHNRIAQFIIENGYGYETDVVPGETIPLFQGLVNDDVQVSMEIWIDQQPEFPVAVEEGTVIDLGLNFPEATQGWWVPTYVIEGDEERGIEPMAPDLSHVDDLPEYTELFQDPEDPDKGRFYDCIAGWECEKIHEAKFEVYGLNEHYNRFLPGSGAALATSLVSAYEQGEPWVGYYWAPTWIFGQLDLTMIEEPEYTDECWEVIFEGEDACAYPAVPVHIAVSDEFHEQAPDIIEFLSQYDTTTDQTSEGLLYMFENDADAEEAAEWFLNEHEDVWTEWVPEQVAEDVRAALNS